MSKFSWGPSPQPFSYYFVQKRTRKNREEKKLKNSEGGEKKRKSEFIYSPALETVQGGTGIVFHKRPATEKNPERCGSTEDLGGM